uniref:Ig-like domain-containing protein n=1 Tax=Stegastes partitus TaxID=144197 RepID=A0A3B5B9C3_9TELE
MIISLDVLPSIYEEGAVDFVTQEHDDLKIAFEVTEMPPRFINPICDMETPEGTTIMFECSLMGIPSPIVSWFKGDKKIPHNNKKYVHSSDGDNHFLKICKVGTQDSGVYTCRAINLTAVSLGTRFTVRVSGLPKPTVQWSHNGKLIKSSSAYRLLEEKQEFTLVITQVTSEYEGEYSCTAANRFGQTTCTTYLEVKKPEVSQAEKWVEKMFKVSGQPPTFTAQIQPVRCSEGGEVSFHYKADGDPVPAVKWYKGAFQIQPSRNCIITASPDGSGFISMKSVKQEDSGLYSCKASNQFGEATCSAELTPSGLSLNYRCTCLFLVLLLSLCHFTKTQK